MSASPRFGHIYFDLEEQRQLEGQYRENSGRLAQATAQWRTDGAGWSTATDPIRFDSPFTGPPSVEYGYQIDKIPDPELWHEPQCTGGVARWITNAEGKDPDKPIPGGIFYLGFWPTVTVTVPPLPLAPGYTRQDLIAWRVHLIENPPVVQVTHYFTMRADAYKKLPRHVDEALKR